MSNSTQDYLKHTVNTLRNGTFLLLSHQCTESLTLEVSIVDGVVDNVLNNNTNSTYIDESGICIESLCEFIDLANSSTKVKGGVATIVITNRDNNEVCESVYTHFNQVHHVERDVKFD